jgi:Zn-dependent M28 family amino/carboxypeptidase
MHGSKIAAILITALFNAGSPPKFSGTSALEYTRKAVALGPRPAGSLAHGQLEQFITKELKSFGCRVSQDTWTAQTPAGPVKMTNIMVRIPGNSGRAIVVTGHYDTKFMPEIRFVGANDAGSSTGVLLEFARVLCRQTGRVHDLHLVWFDGEEAIHTWTDDDSLYGSRRLAQRWSEEGTLRSVIALINLDMIGDKDLEIVDEILSTDWLRKLFRDAAVELGYGRHLGQAYAVGDDHLPFLKHGVPAIDLIDFEYGPGNSYWHTDEDTMDKLSANSFQVVGDIVLRMIKKLEN